MDGIAEYHDHLDLEDDLEPVFARLETQARGAGPDFAGVLELVATIRGERGLFVVQLVARRTHPVDTPPIQVRVYAVLGEFDVGALGAPGRSVDPVATRLRTVTLRRLSEARTPEVLLGGLADELHALCGRLERSVRETLCTHHAAEIILGCVVRRQSSVGFDDYALCGGAADPALFRPHPGFREASYYLHL